MDDPWGSPWATNDSNPILEPRPRAIRSATLELPGRLLTRDRSSTSISPWAVEDDAFNGWAAPDSGLALPTAAATSGSGWSGWGGENGLNSSQTQLSARAVEGALGSPNPAWLPALSPGLQPSKTLSRRSSSRSLSRQPTPDPWATETSEKRLSLPAAVHIAAEQAAFSTLDSHDEVEEEDLGRTEGDHRDGTNETFETISERRSENAPEAVMYTKVFQEPDGLVETEPEQDEGHHSGTSVSRHSSISNESHREERIDSSVTSMDDDARDPPRLTRKDSTKVQDTEELSDGVATGKESNTLLVPNPDGIRRGSIRSIRTDGASDFGDFEDAEGFDSAVPSRQASVSESQPTSSAGHLRNTSTALAAVVQSPTPEEPNRFEEIRARFGSVQFTTDMDLVDKLFDVAKLDKEQPPAKDYSLDTVEGIINDSFTSISERKTWYRISRPGTMRKHDLGDDDNYRRVTWAGSQVKEDATKIVRRWMEEDAFYAGRPKAGGGPMVRGGGFDWDSSKSKAETLSFDEIFGKRKSVQTPRLPTAQTRSMSLQASGHARSSSDSVNSLPIRSPLSIPAPPAGVAFGWSTGDSGASTPVSVRPPSLVRHSFEASSMRSASSRPPSLRESDTQPPLQFAPPPTKFLPESLKLKDQIHFPQQDEDDDDEWGEMVASPTTDARTASGFVQGSLNGSVANLSTTSLALPAAVPDTPTTLNSVSSAPKESPHAIKHMSQSPSTAAPVDVWDFSAFDSTPAALAIPPTKTSVTEFDFDTPLQSPTISIPSRTASPASIHNPKPPTPTIPSRSGSPVLDFTRAPASPIPFRPQHSAKSSLSLVRPSPLHNVLTPEVTAPDPALPTTPPPKSVSFAEDDEHVDDTAVRRVIDQLPDLSYMLR